MSDSHVLPLRTYMAVFLALLVGTAVTTAVAFLDLGAMNTAVALSIALVKALLVVLYFMHVKFAGRLIWLFLAAGLLWLALLFGLMMGDYQTRPRVQGWEAGPGPMSDSMPVVPPAALPPR